MATKHWEYSDANVTLRLAWETSEYDDERQRERARWDAEIDEIERRAEALDREIAEDIAYTRAKTRALFQELGPYPDPIGQNDFLRQYW